VLVNLRIEGSFEFTAMVVVNGQQNLKQLH
jgi:hypothetical protein